MALVWPCWGSISSRRCRGSHGGNNVGPGWARPSVRQFHQPAGGGKWLLCVGMLMGRLEILTVLVLLTPTFWRR
ncbi:hypothetical protein DSL92_07225 [Billgrantia gudaonensis]|uniref:TrkH family potassium uptake protein n=1 Tax=Billgrantia gudaonensis TaxID=376427 RepID=A0A432JH33_9GAMM|nr:hypothetical protein DSL92_07225 [Halomonas gudaonensis]